jgi:hypothetical protein
MLENSSNTISLSEAGNSSTGGGGAPSAGGNDRKPKVIHDSRGNAVWDWGVATGVFARIKSAELLTIPTTAAEVCSARRAR